MTRRFEHTPLHSRVARRLFVVFVLCALLPFVATASYALLELGRVANESDSARLGYTAKSYALELSGNLALADEAAYRSFFLSCAFTSLVRAAESSLNFASASASP